jgi:hypothetical protein
LLVTLLKQGEVIDLEEALHLVDDLPRISNEELQAAALDRNSLLAELPTLTSLPDPAKEGVEPVGSDETAAGAPMRIEASIGAGGPLNDASTVEEAVDRVTAGIRGRLEKGDLLVIWLLDASNSLVDDRQRVAERLKSFFLEIQSSGQTHSGHRLLNAVVSFGASTKEHIVPTVFSDRIVRAVKKLPIDASGKENIFTAIDKSVTKYGRTWKAQLMIVAWTDESGDDAEKLEETIALCRQRRVSVSVVGPSAVLGADTGLHAYTDTKSHRVFQLPVTRGPDTAWPERLRMPYWFSVKGRFGRGRGPLPSWVGGNDLKGIASGFSPFALTRLTLETGGSYTIFDAPEDQAPFSLEGMREYAPDYGSADQYRAEVHAHPLRQAVYDAVTVTQRGRAPGPPDLMLFAKRSRTPPHRLERPYLTPAQFRSKLRSTRRQLLRDAGRTANLVEQALLKVSAGDDPAKGLEYEYSSEQSRRWRAWYDLTRGRLLATSVRLEEYRLVCERMQEPSLLQETTNYLMLAPLAEMQSGEKFAGRAREANRLLSRCMRDNAETPWAYLARAELEYGLGLAVRQFALHPVAASSSRAPTLPKF